MERRTVERVVILANTSKKDFRAVCERFADYLRGKKIESTLLSDLISYPDH